ncbi:hypothetical protein C0585_00905 [Candidatus Woesearchaeota archaeon]|uniref:DNA primase family protein n=1 Tax=uncultured Arcobacter sp. TaxID=165434 RepID=UPI000CC3732D|nr:phage/plasmid primase, P4 family [uncultured Arcobacter sp.]PLW80742.1 MAG: hypothetical protein C0585_00905 [Candidatus Woesearchaeota archaeon]
MTDIDSMKEFAEMIVKDFGKFGRIEEDGSLIIDSGFQSQKIGEVRKVNQIIDSYLDKSDLAKQIWEIQPYFYDRSRIWWLWDKAECRWKNVDDKDILNMVSDHSSANTVSSKEKTEIIESMQQYGRRKIPLTPKETWIQFRDLIVDVMTGEEFKATPDYFVTNPIPYALHKDKFINTPTMDRIFEEWVGKDYVKTLYEIIAYCLIPSYPIHRIFCFIGGGMNGKSKFLELLRKFIGDYNCGATELDTLLNSRFELTRLHKKLVCQMGETNFNEMSKTSMLKKLSGGDLIGFEYKNKDLLEEINYAKILISTNNLPSTTDKTIGFYRRWMIIDFPNQFSEKKDILGEIPEEEYEILAVKSLGILKDLLDKREFHKEGSVEERMERYESKSNFLDKFLKNFIIEDANHFITKSDFIKKFLSWSNENRYRIMSETSIGKKMKEMGFESTTKYFDWLHDGRGGNARVWLGIKWKD